MVTNQLIDQLEEKLHFERFPALELLFLSLDQCNLEFELKECESGAEIHLKNQVQGNPNRAYLRIFFPMDTKCVLFFHKKSIVPFSRDRFSYGGVVIDERSKSRYGEFDAMSWIDYLHSGLQPTKKPATLKKSIPYSIPEDEVTKNG
jgi:hypothetical protein